MAAAGAETGVQSGQTGASSTNSPSSNFRRKRLMSSHSLCSRKSSDEAGKSPGDASGTTKGKQGGDELDKRASVCSGGSVGRLSSGSGGVIMGSPRVRPSQKAWLDAKPARKTERSERSSIQPFADLDERFGIELNSQLRWRNRNLLAHTQAFLPNLISGLLHQCAQGRHDLQMPLLETRNGCVATLNCSGFVELTALLEKHVTGAAMLSRYINKFFTHVIDIVLSYRGDVVRFNSNTIVVFFEASEDDEAYMNACGSLNCMHMPLELACIRAAACSLELHKRKPQIDVVDGDERLALQIGVGAGQLAVLVVNSGESTEFEHTNKYTVVGPAVAQANLAEKLAGSSETVFSPQAWLHVAPTAREGDKLEQQPDYHRFIAFNTRMHTYPMVRHAALQSITREVILPISSTARPGTVRRCLSLLLNFLPDSVHRHAWAGTLINVNELRMLTVAFVQVEGVDATIDDGAQTVAAVISELHKAAFGEEGYLHRFLIDDRGLQVQFAFGLPPLVHTDDALRACRACARLLQVASQFDLKGRAGIATGKVFCGLVGSDRRHEYGIVGTAVQLASSLVGMAQAGSVLVDAATRLASVDLGFEPLEVAVDGLNAPPVQAYRLRDPDLKLASSRESAKNSPSSGNSSQQVNGTYKIDPTPCTPPVPHPPPWLVSSEAKEGKMTTHWEQSIPTLWTHICAERPPPPPPPSFHYGYNKPWRTFIKVPLPWPARSTECGGVSPLPRLRDWQHLLEAEKAVDQYVDEGGGLVALVGPFGCGKTELTEHLVNRAVQSPARMQPIFGAMEAHVGQRWTAICGVVRGAMALLQPSGRLSSAKELCELLRQEETSDAEARALALVGLSDPSSPRPGLCCPDLEEEKVRETCAALVAVARRLIERLLVSGSLVISLRISQGSSVLPVDIDCFWMLARVLGELSVESTERGRQHPLVVLVTCREMHLAPFVEAKHAVVNLGPLTAEEIQRYIHVCLDLSEEPHSDGSPHSLRDTAAAALDLPSGPELGSDRNSDRNSTLSRQSDASRSLCGEVPDRLVHWLRRIVDLPRNVEEGLTQLRRAGVIAITGGRCVVRADMSLLNTADWINTHMVGRIISQMEVMMPEMQHVLQIATVVPGGFSSLDLAAATRIHLSWDTPNMLSLYHCVKHLMACKELVYAGFLRRIDGQTFEPGAEVDAQEFEAAGACLPRWVVTSYLIQQVVSSTVLQGARVQLKRTILLGRAMERLRFKRKTKLFSTVRPSTLSNSMEHTRSNRSKALRHPSSSTPSASHSQHMMAATQSLRSSNSSPPPVRPPHLHPQVPQQLPEVGLKQSKSQGLPSSCIITSATYASELPRLVDEEEDDGSASVSLEVQPQTVSFLNVDHDLKRRQMPSQSWDWQKWKIFHKWAVFSVLVVVLLYPDLWIIFEGSTANLDAVMLLAVVFFAGNIVFSRRYDDDYTYFSVLKDLVLIVFFFLDVSFAMAMPRSDLAIQRRNPAHFWRVVGLYIKFGACAVRLALFIRSIAAMLRIWYEKRVKNRRSHNVQPEAGSRMLDDISKRLTQAILLYMVFFSILIVLSVQIVDLYTPPKEDASMKSWVQLLTHEADINTTASTALSEELQRFKQFYEQRSYGPFHICLGEAQEPFTCQQVLWDAPASSDFPNPQRESFTLNVHSASVQASFNFLVPCKQEALIRIVIIFSTVICLVIVALSLDSVANGLVVSPLAKLLPTVRQVMAQLHEKFPSLERNPHPGEDYDEVAEFEDMVRWVTLFVTSHNQNDARENTAASEWINGGLGTETERTLLLNSSSTTQRDLSEVPTPDPNSLQEFGVTLEVIESWQFDVLGLNDSQLAGVSGWLLLESANPYLSVQPVVVSTFLDAMSQEYRRENPYHNWRHACDVLHTVYRGCQVLRVTDFTSRADVFALLVAAIAHDAGHPGLNNIFLVQTSHELALRYNDLSPLENMHCSTMFRILTSREDANVFATLTREQYKSARKVCIETILHTDNAKHFEMIKELQVFYHTNSESLEETSTMGQLIELLKQPGNQRLALEALLHGADISNPCKPWKICESWADLVLGEFFLQGDREKEMGIPVQMLNNRDTVNKPSSQVAFIEFFIYPFNTALVKIFSPLWEFSGNLVTNLQKWQAMRTPEEQEKTGQKIQTICDEVLKVAQEAKHKSREVTQGLSETTRKTPTQDAAGSRINSHKSDQRCASKQVLPLDAPRRLSEVAAPNQEGKPPMIKRSATLGALASVGALGSTGSRNPANKHLSDNTGIDSLMLARQKGKARPNTSEGSRHAPLPHTVSSDD